MKLRGTCIWFGPEKPWGYLGFGIFTNNAYENQIYCHYKNIVKQNLRNPKYREIKPNDICEFEIGEGYMNPGTQALKVKIVKYAESEHKIGRPSEIAENGSQESF